MNNTLPRTLLKVLVLASLIHVPAVRAGCEDVCEADCKGRCPKIFGKSEPVCYEACLATERLCKSNFDVTRTVCRAQPGYLGTLASGKALRAAGQIKTEQQCRDQGAWATKYMEQAAGEALARIGSTCSCLLCEEVMSGSGPTPSSQEQPVIAPPQRARGPATMGFSDSDVRKAIEAASCDGMYEVLRHKSVQPATCSWILNHRQSRSCGGPFSC